MKRILVIRGGAIGDFVLTLPAIKLLREAFPNAHIEILGYPQIAALADKRFYAQAVRSIESGALASFFARGAELPLELSHYFQSFDLVVSYLFDPEQIFEGNLRRCGAKEYLACSPKISGSEHTARQLARPLEQIGLSLIDPAASLYPSAADRDFAQAFLADAHEPVVALHPGSGSATKNWPIAKWLQILEWLLASKRTGSLLIVGGEADEKEMTELRAKLSTALVRFAENLPLPHLAATIEKCALFLGHDSGISHVAAAMGTPCVLLFGPSDPAVWAPKNASVHVLRGPNELLESLDPEVVQEAISARLNQSRQQLSS